MGGTKRKNDDRDQKQKQNGKKEKRQRVLFQKLIKCIQEKDLEKARELCANVELDHCAFRTNDYPGGGFALAFALELDADEIFDYLMLHPNTTRDALTDLVEYVSMEERFDLLPRLEAAGADIRTKNDYAFRLACEKGHLNVAKRLHQTYDIDVCAKDNYSIGLAAQNGHLDVCKWLVAHGADLHADSEYSLVYASKEGHLEVVDWLLEQGADLHAQDGLALQAAAGNNHGQVVHRLLAAGACSEMAMIQAANGRHLALCKELRERYVISPLLCASTAVYLSQPRHDQSVEEFAASFRVIDAFRLGYYVTESKHASTCKDCAAGEDNVTKPEPLDDASKALWIAELAKIMSLTAADIKDLDFNEKPSFSDEEVRNLPFAWPAFCPEESRNIF